jgi:serine/threonine protein kinase
MIDYAGQRLGNYRLLKLLGSGGFARVYLGEHIYLKTPAAIKVLQVRLTQEALNHFLAEARTIARLSHPNIIRVLEFGIEDETPFLVMNYAPYGSLRQRHPTGNIVPLTRVLSYVRQMAAALQYAHERQIIHRDVKPENMLLGDNFVLLLSDFGIAMRAPGAGVTSTPYAPPNAAGTTTYMAPEQINGAPEPASDQYALAVVVYEWLCGTPPFSGGEMLVALQHLQAPPPAPREKVPTLPPALDRVLLTALAKDPQARFPSVRAFAQALEEACGEQPSAASSAMQLWQPGAPGSRLLLSAGPRPAAQNSQHAAPTVVDQTPLPAGPLVSTPAPGRGPGYVPAHSTPALPLPTLPLSPLTRRRLVLGLGATALATSSLCGIIQAVQALTQPRATTPTRPQPRATATRAVTPTPNLQATAQAIVSAINSRPALASWGPRQLDLFVRGGDNALWHRHFDGTWHAWESLGGTLAFDPVAVAWSPGRFDLFVRGADNSLQHRWYDGSWHDWEVLGGNLTTSPAVASWGAGRLDIFARGPDNALWHRWYDGLWRDWESLGGVITSAPAATSWGPGRLDVFARGLDNALWHRAFEGQWGPWEPLGSSFIFDPSVASWGNQRLDVFTCAADGSLQHLAFDGTWHAWESLGGTLSSSPTALSWGPSYIDIFARNDANALQHLWYDGSWHPWAPLV